VAESPEAFVEQCDGALAERDPQALQRRLDLANQNNWDARVSKLLGLVDAALRKPGSPVQLATAPKAPY
jgi:hypothetical protein